MLKYVFYSAYPQTATLLQIYYCKKVVGKTSVANRTLNPNWNESFTLEFSDESRLEDSPIEFKYAYFPSLYLSTLLFTEFGIRIMCHQIILSVQSLLMQSHSWVFGTQPLSPVGFPFTTQFQSSVIAQFLE